MKNTPSCRLLALLSGVAISSAFAAAAPAAPPPAPIDFNRDVRPILSENCFYCHGQDPNRRKKNLRLDERASAVSRAIVPGKPDESALVERIISEDADEQMPPPDSHRQLTAQQKQVLKRWIAEGAKYSPHWTFVAPVRPPVPAAKRTAWVRNPIDTFVLARLEAEGLDSFPGGRPRHLEPPGDVRPHGPAADAGRSGRLPGRPGPRRLRKVGRSPAGVTGTTASGWPCPGSTPPATPTATASSRTATLSSGSGATGSCEALNDDMPFDQFTDRATGRRPAAQPHDRPEGRHRLQPQPPAQRRGGRNRRGAAEHHPVRPRGHDGHHLAWPDHRLRPVPRPQVRPAHPA